VKSAQSTTELLRWFQARGKVGKSGSEGRFWARREKEDGQAPTDATGGRGGIGAQTGVSSPRPLHHGRPWAARDRLRDPMDEQRPRPRATRDSRRHVGHRPRVPGRHCRMGAILGGHPCVQGLHRVTQRVDVGRPLGALLGDRSGWSTSAAVAATTRRRSSATIKQNALRTKADRDRTDCSRRAVQRRAALRPRTDTAPP